jgi:hypothetical protein
MEILTTGNSTLIEQSNLEVIANRIFDVQKIQLTSSIEGYEMPDSYGIYNTTNKKCLGVVGSQYTPTQPSELMGSFIDCLDSNNVDFEQLKYSELKGGSKVLFSSPYKTISFKNIRGIEDESIISINLQTGYDGLTKTSLFLSMYRLICTNGMKANRTEFTTSFKNTAGNKGKINNICNDVAKSINMFNDLESMILHLNSTPVNQLAIKNFLHELTGINIDKKEEESTRSLNIYNDLLQSIDTEFRRTGASAWGLLNGITYYTNHVATAENRQDYILVDKGETMNRKAQELVLQIN